MPKLFSSFVAHEITHAFDDVGILYDSDGTYKPLYDNQTIQNFRAASDCIKKQYSQYKIDDQKVDGNNTLGENIADHGGLKVAEIAYDKWLQQNGGIGADIALPALQNYTDKQLFYLGYALPWCAVHTDTLLKTHVMKDEHAPDRFRVIGPLSNSHKFSKVWGCAKDTKMNKPEKCQVW